MQHQKMPTPACQTPANDGVDKEQCIRIGKEAEQGEGRKNPRQELPCHVLLGGQPAGRSASSAPHTVLIPRVRGPRLNFLFSFLLFFFFLGLHPLRREVLRLGVESDLQLLA